jgi:hypothetical protein
MFIQSSSKGLQYHNHSFPDPDGMDNLLKALISSRIRPDWILL